MNSTTEIQAQICVLNICGQWLGTAQDKQVEAEVGVQHNTDAKSGRYTKKLFPEKSCGKTNPHTTWMVSCRKVREYWKDHTSPWEDGRRIVAASFLDQFESQLSGYIEEANAAMQKFMEWYPEGKEQAKGGLNGLFKEGDYPSDAQLRQNWAVNVTYNPIPQSHHFIQDIHSPALERAKKDLADANKIKIDNAVKAIWMEVLAPVEHLAQQLANPADDARLFDSLVTNIKDVASRIPALDFMGSPELAEAQQRLNTLADSINLDDLRKNPMERSPVSEAAMQIVNQFGKYTRKMKV